MRIQTLTLLLTALPATLFAGPTYTKDIAPILNTHCVSCHRPGEVGPFSLSTYKDVAKRADFLVEITQSQRMPPWKAEAGYGAKFHDERKLTAAELKTLSDWAKAGSPEGDTKDLPPAPKFPVGWQLGEPDLVLKMPEVFTVPAGGKDIQQCFPIPIPIDSDRTVAAVEFRPGNRSVVHHAILYLDSNGMARRKDQSDPGPGFKTFGGPGFLPTGGLGGWAPGATVHRLPEGTGKYLKKGSDLVLQIHYHPTGKEEKDQSSVGIYFTKEPAKQIVGGIGVRSRGLNIPPNESAHKVTAESDVLPADVDVISVSPHMHNVGRVMKAYAKTPDGKEIPLIWIKDWDFNWQGAYQYEKAVRVPKGSVIHVEAVYDNSTGNPKNPNSPPKAVRWGEQTTDEMCLFGVQVVTDSLDDLRKVMGMKNNLLGTLLAGGPPKDYKGPKAATGDTPEKKDFDFPTGGIPIPEKLKEIGKRLDKNEDGKLSKDEFDALPEPIKDRIREMIKNRKKDK